MSRHPQIVRQWRIVMQLQVIRLLQIVRRLQVVWRLRGARQLRVVMFRSVPNQVCIVGVIRELSGDVRCSTAAAVAR